MRPCGHPQARLADLDKGLKHAGLEPALALVVHRRLGGQVVRHQPPRGPRADDPAQAIEDLAQAVLPLGRVFRHERQVGGHQGPLVITDITGVGFARQTASVASAGHKCITRSREKCRDETYNFWAFDGSCNR